MYQTRVAMMIAVLAIGISGFAAANAVPESGSTNASQPPAGATSKDESGARPPAASGSVYDGASTIEEITITAQRHAENLEDAPVAVTAFTTEQRELRGLETVDDLAKFVPSVSYQDYPNRLSIRGVSRFTNAIGTDPGTSVYYDGIYSPETGAISQPPNLIDRVEILRGPQGTLYGRNTIGGAVNIISKRPTSDLEGDVRLITGNYDTEYLSGYVSGPITDRFRYRISAQYAYQGRGYVDNLAGDSLGKQRTGYIESQFDYALDDRTKLWVKLSYSDAQGSGQPNVRLDPYNTTQILPANTLVPNPTYGYGQQNPANAKTFVVEEDQPGYVKTKSSVITTQFSHDFDNMVLRYTGGVQQFDFSSLSDFDSTSRTSFLYESPAAGPIEISAQQEFEIVQNSHSYSNEVSLAAKPDASIQWIGGLYQSHENNEQPLTFLMPNQPQLKTPLTTAIFYGIPVLAAPNPAGLYLYQDAHLYTTSLAGYGQAQFPITQTIKLTAGIRYTNDFKDGFEQLREILFTPDFPGVSNCCSIDVTPAVNQRELKDNWASVTGRLALDWKVDPNTLVYGSVSRGYKSGGFNLGSLAPEATVKPETLIATELGAKKIINKSLELDAATFYYFYDDLQVLYNADLDGTTEPVFVNAARARSYGFELETKWKPIDPLTLLLNYSYLNATFSSFCCIPDIASANPTALQNEKGQTLPQSPKNKFGLDALYGITTRRGLILSSAAYSYTSSQFYGAFNTSYYSGPHYSSLDLKLDWAPFGKSYTVGAYLKNALNEQAYNGLTILAGTRFVTPNPPRVFGATFDVRF